MPRKTPVLLRPAPMTGGVNVLTNYRRTTRNGRDMITAMTDGKHDVTADFDAIVLEHLFPIASDCALVTSALDGVAQGRFDELTVEECKAVGQFRKQLVKLTERHNEKGHGQRSSGR